MSSYSDREVSGLVDLINKSNLCDDPFDNELLDISESLVEGMIEEATKGGTRGIVEFMLRNGYSAESIRSLIKDYET